MKIILWPIFVMALNLLVTFTGAILWLRWVNCFMAGFMFYQVLDMGRFYLRMRRVKKELAPMVNEMMEKMKKDFETLGAQKIDFEKSARMH